jgi:alpha-N-acetylgalactosaminidase
MTDLVVSEGYAAVGYEYINIDDCWLEKDRSYSGQLVPDRLRFPYGLHDLSDYVSYMMLQCEHVQLCCSQMNPAAIHV